MKKRYFKSKNSLETIQNDNLNKAEHFTIFYASAFHGSLNTLVSGCFWGFSKKKRLNARGFAWEFLRSGMLYRPSKSLKRLSKSSILHSKKIFCLGCVDFLWVTS